jgi:hypothetical protein
VGCYGSTYVHKDISFEFAIKENLIPVAQWWTEKSFGQQAVAQLT